MDEFKMKIMKKDEKIIFHTEYGKYSYSHASFYSDNKKDIKKYLKKFEII